MSTRSPWLPPLMPLREPEDEVHAVNLKSLLETGKFSDLKLSCGGREFAVHKAILCSQSRVFSAECEGGFEESRTNIIKIEEFDADTVQRMLDFLYSGDYTVPQETVSFNDGSGQAQLEGNSDGRGRTFSLDLDESDNGRAAVTKKDILGWHLRANAIGDYYDIQPLCTLSRSKLRNHVNRHWSPVDFMHLLTEACTTRKTGDLKFHRLLGQTMSHHLEDLAGLQGLQDLEIRGVILTSIVASSLARVKSLQRDVAILRSTIQSLEQSNSAFVARLTMAQNPNVHRDVVVADDFVRNAGTLEGIPTYEEVRMFDKFQSDNLLAFVLFRFLWGLTFDIKCSQLKTLKHVKYLIGQD